MRDIHRRLVEVVGGSKYVQQEHPFDRYPSLTIVIVLTPFVGAYDGLQSRNLVRLIRFAVFVSQGLGCSRRGRRYLWKRGNEQSQS